MRVAPIVPPATLGILGGGQLGRYTVMAAASMGYQMGAYALGYLDDLRDPIRFLRDAPDGADEAPTFSPDR